MGEERSTTAVVHGYLDELAGDRPAEPVIRALLEQAVHRLHELCAALLHRSYPRLTRPPLNLQVEEMLGAVVERLLKALREIRPGTVRQFSALASQHMSWELNEMAHRSDGASSAAGRHPPATRPGPDNKSREAGPARRSPAVKAAAGLSAPSRDDEMARDRARDSVLFPA